MITKGFLILVQMWIILLMIVSLPHAGGKLLTLSLLAFTIIGAVLTIVHIWRKPTVVYGDD